MQTPRDSVAEVVLKTVAFQDAVGSAALTRLLQESRKYHSDAPARATHHGDFPEEGAAAQEDASFTFHLPSGSAPALRVASQNRKGNSSPLSSPAAPVSFPAAATAQQQQQQEQHAAQSLLREALQRHEAALRVWADTPLHRLATSTPTAVSAAAAAAAADNGGALSQCDERVLMGGVSGSVTHTVVQPYSRVLARGSVAGIGLPRPRLSERDTATVASVAECQPPRSPEDSTQVEDGYVPSQSSVSDGLPLPAAHTMSSVSAPLLPYQLQLRMRHDAPADATSSQHGGVVEARRGSFQRAQACRYAEWHRQQAAVLHRLVPDMWERELPPYAAFDRAPHVMDGGLCNGASTVRRARQDGGVVYV